LRQPARKACPATASAQVFNKVIHRPTRRSKVKGYTASTLVKKLWELRFDLSEEAEEFVNDLHEQLKEHGVNLALSDGGQWRYVFSLCHEVGEIERYVAFE
jgi:hypothetical protein